MAARPWHIGQALDSYPSLLKVLSELTEEEVLHALSLESASRRRQSIIDRLISRAVRLNELSYAKTLKEKYHGKDPHQG